MKCKDCKYWKKDKYNYGACHKYAPKNVGYNGWPHAHGKKDWCGEFEAKEEETEKQKLNRRTE